MLTYSEGMPGGPGTYIEHSHPHEQMLYIIQGTVELTAGGETVTLKAGSSALLEPNEYHELRGVGDEKIKLLDIFHPPQRRLLDKRITKTYPHTLFFTSP